MSRRLRNGSALILTVAVATLGALTIAEPASAGTPYRSPVNPMWTSGNYSLVDLALRGDTFTFWREQETGDLRLNTQQMSKIGRARRAWGAMPPLAKIGNITLAIDAFTFGWRIGRGIDDRFLHLSGDIGQAVYLPQAGDYKAMPVQWVFAAEGVGLPGSWWLRIKRRYMPSGAENTSYATFPAHPEAAAFLSAAAQAGGEVVTRPDTSKLHQTVNGGPGTATILSLSTCTTTGGCYYVKKSDAAMAEAVGANTLGVPYTGIGQTVNVTTPHTMPGTRTFASPETTTVINIFTEDESDAEAAANAAGPTGASHGDADSDGIEDEDETGAMVGGKTADPDFEGYPYPEATTGAMVECVGLAISACEALLTAADFTGGVNDTVLGTLEADLDFDADEITSQSPTAGVESDHSSALEVTVNPSEALMPVVMPALLPGETSAEYEIRLTALGITGTVTTTTLTEEASDATKGPSEVVTVVPAEGTLVPKTTTVTLYENPDTLAPLPGEGSAGCEPWTDHSLNFDPLLDVPLGSAFPFGLFGYVLGVVDLFDASPQAPEWTVEVSALEELGKPADYTIDLAFFDGYMATIRGLLSFVLWAGAIWFFAASFLGFRTSNPAEAADD